MKWPHTFECETPPARAGFAGLDQMLGDTLIAP